MVVNSAPLRMTMAMIPSAHLVGALWVLAFLGIPNASAAIGPVADLEIVNKVISPDGFNRS